MYITDIDYQKYKVISREEKSLTLITFLMKYKSVKSIHLLTLKELVNAALISVELIFADRGLNLKVFCGTNFADAWIRNILRH